MARSPSSVLVADGYREAPAPTRCAPLSEREVDLLRLLVDGRTTKQIASSPEASA
jgi:DNA-binding NarL/FixJ family response regulator